ncbi:peptidoglycan DD-metalloendopeptidase family protein [Nitrosomonas halophila]|uniref:Lipoprotein NlpD n=1 Tax=Nitrosomonas halophila TaxID=44576 RepID=A0A1H3NBX7_9PROT|nr:peptidoglycan DD-metalloendopeptidase family protein [Nitrosomonas halophila]SDY86243.1 lipoprotein NlpD [Nitrosomonas halophila]
MKHLDFSWQALMIIGIKFFRHGVENGFKPRHGLALFAGLLLSACVSKPHPVPVVEHEFGRYQSIPGRLLTDQSGRRIYIVQRGDTLYGIALKYGLDINQLAERNRISDPAVLRVGQEIELYAAGQEGQVSVQEQSSDQPALFAISQSGYIQSEGGGYQLETLAANGGQSSTLLKTEPKGTMLAYSEAATSQLNKQQQDKKVTPAQHKEAEAAVATQTATQKKSEDKNRSGINWAWPADGKVVNKFSEKARGVGIAGSLSQPVLASAAGTVVYSGSGLRGYGNLVIIKHNETYLSAYGHNRKVLVHEGEKVSRGQKIAEMGNTDSGAVKLHFEIRERGKPVDPLNFLPYR